MNIDDIRCWFEEFGVRGLACIRTTPNAVILEFAGDWCEVIIEPAQHNRCHVTVRVDGRNEPAEYRGLDLQGLIALLKNEGKEVRQ